MKYARVPNCLGSPPGMSDFRTFVTDHQLGIILSTDDTPKWGPLKHASVSHQDRYPTWDELIEVKEYFFGDVDCMMIMPKKKDYVNLNPNCFHIWQTPQEWGIG